MKQLKISVVMSVYNGERYLREAVESVLNQSFRDFEFLIVNDGSSDATPKILKECASGESRIKIIANQRNIGLTRSLNKAIRTAQGEYIARMDADDVALPERFEKQLNFMERNLEVGLSGTAYYEINSGGEVIGQKTFPSFDRELKKVLIRYNPFFHASVMIRKRVLDKVGLYNENIPKAQDYDLWFRIAKHFKVANLTELLMMRRYSEGMISIENENEQIFCALKIRRRAIETGQYSKWNYLYLVRPFLVLRIPSPLRKFLRAQLLGKKIYD